MAPSARTALVHEWLTVPGGAEEVLREVLPLYPGTIYTAQYDARRFPWLKGADVRSSWVSRLPFSKTRHYIYAPLLPWVYRRIDLSPYDLVLTDSHSFAHHARARPDAVHVCYYHTPARSLWAPDVDDRAERSALRRMLAKRLRKLDLEASKNPSFIIANSRTTAERLVRVYGRQAREVIYPPVDTRRWSDVRRVSDDEGFLAWGRLVPYKRFDLAIEATRMTGAKLNIVGAGPQERSLKAMALGSSSVRFHGRLSDTDLKALMGRSKAVLFPCYEDFGIIPVEAMAAGLPVVAYSKGGAAETVLEGCGVQFHVQTADALAAAMREVDGHQFDPAFLARHASQYDSAVFRERYKAAVEAACAEAGEPATLAAARNH